MIGYIFALLPLYVLLYLPLQHMLSGSRNDALKFRGTQYNASLIASDEPVSCPTHNYNTFVVSRQPLIIYIENFLSPEESKHLLDIRYLMAWFFTFTPAFPSRRQEMTTHLANFRVVTINSNLPR